MGDFIMKSINLSILIFLLLISANLTAMTELGFDFGYSKQVYGYQKQNSTRERTYTGSMALYFLTLTAIEFNYSNSKEITTDNTVVKITGSDYSIMGYQNTIDTNVYGIGLRQSLVGGKSRIRPLISLGYAKQFIKDSTNMTYRNDVTNLGGVVLGNPSKKRQDSVFATFALKFIIGKGLNLQGSVKTVFPAFKMGLAKDYVKYTVGFTWMF